MQSQQAHMEGPDAGGTIDVLHMDTVFYWVASCQCLSPPLDELVSGCKVCKSSTSTPQLLQLLLELFAARLVIRMFLSDHTASASVSYGCFRLDSKYGQLCRLADTEHSKHT